MQNNLATLELYNNVISLLKDARNSVIRTVNHTMVVTYYQIGKMIIEEEQNGNNKSDYGSNLIDSLSKRLTSEFGKGFSTTNTWIQRCNATNRC